MYQTTYRRSSARKVRTVFSDRTFFLQAVPYAWKGAFLSMQVLTDSRPDRSFQGLAAELYDLLYSDEASIDEAFYRSNIERQGGSSLEIGCGTGRLLLPFISSGLDVEGLDCSEAMLAICMAKAKKSGIRPRLHQQTMQSLNLDHVFNTIFVPYCSFMYVTERHDALEALRRFYDHLAPGGQLLLSLFLPSRNQTDSGSWTLRHNVIRPSDSANILVHRAVSRDLVEQLQTNLFRYEVYFQEELKETYLQTTHIRWYGKYELTLMLEKAQFQQIEVCGDFTGCEFSKKHRTMTVRALK